MPCPPSCRCACHKQQRLGTPSFTRKWTGRLMVSCQNFSWRRPACTNPSCRRTAQSSVSVQYTLPLWVATQMISAWYKCAPLAGPEMLLKLSRVVRTDSYYYASQGDVDELRSLYLTGQASIHDIDPADGEPALMVRSSHFYGKICGGRYDLQWCSLLYASAKSQLFASCSILVRGSICATTGACKSQPNIILAIN